MICSQCCLNSHVNCQVQCECLWDENSLLLFSPSGMSSLCDPMDCSPPGLLSVEFSRQEYWSGLPFPSLGDLPNPGIELRSPTSAGRFFTTEPPGKPPNSFQPRLLTCSLFLLWKLRWKPQPPPCPSSARRPSGQLTPPPTPSCLTEHPLASVFPLEPLNRPFSYVLYGLSTKNTVHRH